MQQQLGLVVLALASFGCACTRGSAATCDFYDPRDLTHPRDFEVMSTSPVVFVAMATSVRTLQHGVRACRQPNLLLDLVQVNVSVENVLRGDGVGQRESFRYYSYSPQNGGYIGRPRYDVTAGARRVFFLTRDEAGLRASGDVLDYTFHVYSGSHQQSVVGADLGDSVPRILLSLGADGDPVVFARNILKYAAASDYFGSRPKTAALLSQLVSPGSDPDVRAAACFELASYYYGRYGCLAAIQNGPEFAEAVRKKAAALLRAQELNNANFKELLKADPLTAFTKSPNPDSLYAVREEMEMLLSDPDPSIRTLACSALRKHFPSVPERCSSE